MLAEATFQVLHDTGQTGDPPGALWGYRSLAVQGGFADAIRIADQNPGFWILVYPKTKRSLGRLLGSRFLADAGMHGSGSVRREPVDAGGKTGQLEAYSWKMEAEVGVHELGGDTDNGNGDILGAVDFIY
jgi:hypothetical protein